MVARFYIFNPSSIFTDRSNAILLMCFLVICVSCLPIILHCLFLIAWDRADWYVRFYIFVTFPYGVLGLDCIDS